MPETWYLIAGVVVAGIITLALRALPFAVLKPLRGSRFVRSLGRWMPAGILLILAVVVLRDELAAHLNSPSPERVWIVLAAVAVTIAVHLLGGRRALASIAAGTACYILLMNIF